MKRPVPVGLDPRPGDREAVGVDPEVAHELDVFLRAVVVVAGDGGGVPVQDVARLFGEGVPAGGPAAAGREVALDLEGRGGNSQGESGAQACGEGLNCYRILHSHAPIIHSMVMKDNGPSGSDCTAVIAVPAAG